MEYMHAPLRPFFRIAVPSMRLPDPPRAAKRLRKLSRAETKALFDRGFRPADALHMRLTPAERAQMETAAVLRRALYEVETAA